MRWIFGIMVLLFASPAFAQNDDLFDSDSQAAPTIISPAAPTSDSAVSDKSSEDLLQEAQDMLLDERPLDARTLLLEVLRKNPKEYRAHILLSGYYLVHVGHFRLALKYLDQGTRLFTEANGKPPYSSAELKGTHARILSLLSEIRLNLDNYKGSLEALDQFSSLYFGDWYPGTRAWVLMKLGRLQEAIKVARLGVMAGAEPGRTLNILGILLSMVGEDQEALNVLDQATMYELALGKEGQPATPINNAGEIYREIFQDSKAENNWLKATGMPDGCEHILPTMNLVLLYIDQLKFKNASEALDRFEQCIKQFPLRNGEEHRALLRLARGRIAMHTGKIDQALLDFEDALERRQWFGKIGTNENDMKAASLVSLAQALIRKNNILASRLSASWFDWADSLGQRTFNEWRIWWAFRRARQVLAEDLNVFEDLSIRNTDSMLEYSTLGELIGTFPTTAMKRRIQLETKKEKRPVAVCYYGAYLSQNYLNSGNKAKGLELLENALSCLRPKFDQGLIAELKALKLKQMLPSNSQYSELAYEIYQIAPAWLRNFGLKLPVNFENLEKSTIEALAASSFYPDNDRELAIKIKATHNGQQYTFYFESDLGLKIGPFRGDSLDKVVNSLADAVFAGSP